MEYSVSFYVNGEPVQEIPVDVLERMSKHLSETMTEYFTEHPEEWIKLNSAPMDRVKDMKNERARKRGRASGS